MASEVFGYTGAAETFVVPGGVEEIEVLLRGASGGDGSFVAMRQAVNQVSGWELGASTSVPLGWSLSTGPAGGVLALLMVASRWLNADAPTSFSGPAGWTLHATSATVSGSTHSTRMWVFSKWVTAAEMSGSVTMTAPTGAGRVTEASIMWVLPYLGTTPTVVDVVVDSVGSAGTSWSPSVASPSGRSIVVANLASTAATISNHTVTGLGQPLGATNNPTTWRMDDVRSGPPSSSPSVVKPSGEAMVSVSVAVSAPLPADALKPTGGKGGLLVAKIPVVAGDIVAVEVGGRGVNGNAAPYPLTSAHSGSFGGGPGGGPTRVYVNTTLVAEAGAGGGGGAVTAFGCDEDRPDGGGGGVTGENGLGFTGTVATGTPGNPGTGASGTTSGVGGQRRLTVSLNPASSGGTSQAANGTTVGAGGGGGGRGSGGGGGTGHTNVAGSTYDLRYRMQGGGGGGGSSWVNTAAGAVLIEHFTGDNVGDGNAVVSWRSTYTGWHIGTHWGTNSTSTTGGSGRWSGPH